MKHLWLYFLLAFVAGGLFVYFGYRWISPGVPLVANRTNTVVVYETNYGSNITYYSVPINRIRELTNFYDLTNLIVETRTVSNAVVLTNRLTITNILEMLVDYEYYSTEPFLFRQSNDLLSVSLHKRSADYRIRDWRTPKRHSLGVYYPPLVSYQYAPFADDSGLFGSLSLGGYLGYINSNVVAGVGVGMRW